MSKPCAHPLPSVVFWRMQADQEDESGNISERRRVCLCAACGRTYPGDLFETPQAFDAQAEQDSINAKGRGRELVVE